MNAPVADIWLESCLEPLAPWLERRDVTDIYVNRPAEVWVESLGGAIERFVVPELSREVLIRLARQIAAVSAQGISREHPLLAASLPTGERVQVVIPPATRGDVVIAIRKHVVSGLSLDDYERNGAFSETASTPASDRSLGEGIKIEQGNYVDVLRDAVRGRRNVLISGGTSSGKTTFLNALLREIPIKERLILIEDTPELQLNHPNAVGLIATRGGQGEADVTAEDLLIASLRLRPDRIILGEIRGSEAVTFLRAVNTGHPGSLTTIHADSPHRAIDQLALLVLQTGMRMRWDDVVTYVRRSLDLIVQLERGKGGRLISAVLAVSNG